MTTPNFQRGGKAAEEESRKRNAAGFARVNYLRMEDGERVFIRLIDDSPEWIWINQHEFIPTKGAPEDYKAQDGKKWPDKMSGVCRHDKAFKGIYTDCYICDEMRKPDGKKYRPAIRIYARAVEREAVIGTKEMVEEGKIPEDRIGFQVGFRDKLVEEPVLDSEGKPTEKMETRKKILVLRFGLKNFFGQLQGFYDVQGKLVNRDLAVTRKGTDTDTVYSIVPLDPTPGHDLSDPATKTKYEDACKAAGVDLGRLLVDQSSDEYYARWFDKTKEAPSRKTKDEEPEGAPTEQQTKPQQRAADPDALRRMREKVMSGNPSRQTDAAAAGAANFE